MKTKTLYYCRYIKGKQKPTERAPSAKAGKFEQPNE